MAKEETLEKLRDSVFPIINPEENNQPCKTCRYFNKECIVDLETVQLENGKIVLICAIKLRDSISRIKKKKLKKHDPK